jgi:hypothetical protein
MRQGLLIATALGMLAGCGSSSDSPDPAQQQRDAAQQQQKDCSDPAWKEAHLGVWYSVCRPNAAIR